MTNSEILAKVKSLGVELFGAPVFIQKEVVVPNVTAPLQTARNGSKFITIREGNEGKTFFLRRGVAEKASYDMALFVAERNATGKRADGSIWSVIAGDKRLFLV